MTGMRQKPQLPSACPRGIRWPQAWGGRNRPSTAQPAVARRVELPPAASAFSPPPSWRDYRSFLCLPGIQSPGQHVDFCCLLLLVLVSKECKAALAAATTISAGNRNCPFSSTHGGHPTLDPLACTRAQFELPRSLPTVSLGLWLSQLLP